MVKTSQKVNIDACGTHGPHATPPVGKFNHQKLCKTRESRRQFPPFFVGKVGWDITGFDAIPDPHKQVSIYRRMGHTLSLR